MFWDNVLYFQIHTNWICRAWHVQINQWQFQRHMTILKCTCRFLQNMDNRLIGFCISFLSSTSLIGCRCIVQCVKSGKSQILGGKNENSELSKFTILNLIFPPLFSRIINETCYVYVLLFLSALRGLWIKLKETQRSVTSQVLLTQFKRCKNLWNGFKSGETFVPSLWQRLASQRRLLSQR